MSIYLVKFVYSVQIHKEERNYVLLRNSISTDISLNFYVLKIQNTFLAPVRINVVALANTGLPVSHTYINYIYKHYAKQWVFFFFFGWKSPILIISCWFFIEFQYIVLIFSAWLCAGRLAVHHNSKKKNFLQIVLCLCVVLVLFICQFTWILCAP